MQQQQTVSIPDGNIFDSSQWIGRGRKWPRNPPDELVFALMDQLEVPKDALSPTFPIPPHLPPPQFLKVTLPTATSDLISGQDSLCFSLDPPSTDMRIALGRPIPSIAMVKKLLKRECIGQFWIDGCKSFTDPRYNNGADRFPLSVLTAFEQIHETRDAQGRWARSIAFVQQHLGQEVSDDLRRMAHSVMDLIKTVGWNEVMPAAKISSLELTTFLSNGWLSDTHVELQVRFIRNRLHESPVPGRRIGIAPLGFTNKLLQPGVPQTFEDGNEPCNDYFLRTVESEILNQKLDELYLPAHHQSQHWIALVAHFRNGTMYYGDSLEGTPLFVAPRKLMQKLSLFSRKRIYRNLTDKGPALPIGRQRDTSNCGIVWADALCTAIWGDAPWTPEIAVLRRMSWFERLARWAPSTIISSSSSASAVEPSRVPPPARRTLADLLNSAPAASLSQDPDSDTESGSESEHSKDPDADVAFDYGGEPDSDTDTGHELRGSDRFSDAVSLSDMQPPSPSALSSDFSMRDASSEAPGVTSDEFKSSSVEHIQQSIVDVLGKKRKAASTDSDSAQGKRKTKKLVKKRPSNTAAEDSSSDSDNSQMGREAREAPSRAPGTARSTVFERKLRESVRNGTFVVDPPRWAEWLEKLVKEDPEAEVKADSAHDWRCSVCRQWTKTKGPYDVTRVKEHLKKCRNQPQAKIFHFFKKPAPRQEKPSEESSTSTATPGLKLSTTPCPGISPDDDLRVSTYLERTAVSGGGGKSLTVLAKQRYKKMFTELSQKQRRIILDEQQKSHTWHNHHHSQPVRVYAHDCLGQTMNPAPHRPHPCSNCRKVLTSKAFKKAIRRPKPDDSRYIYTPFRFRPKLLAQIYAKVIGVRELLEEKARKSPFVRYALGAARGQYKHEIFEGLMEAVLTKQDKEDRGVGLQNFRFAPAYDELMHIMQLHSPAAYRAFSEVFPTRTARSWRQKEAREPRIPMEICDETYRRTVEHLEGIGWDGPVGLSCDDTKLSPSLRLYWDSRRKMHMLVGAVEGPQEVADAEQVKQVIAEANLVKASKLRLFCLTPQAPGMAPIIVHAMPIGSKDWGAERLEPYSQTLIRGLVERRVKLVSYACDGTESERSIQRLLTLHADRRVEYEIPGPADERVLKIVIPFFNDQPVAMIQDSKHGLKTYRNNLFSGARMLLLGNHAAFYAQLYTVAFEDGSPLYRRDLEKLDRQDDNAASRLFSADTLQYITENHPDWTFAAIYLFVFGELIDAYQSRAAPHAERFLMVLRAKFFMDRWSAFLECGNYPKARYHLSYACLDITRIIIEGFLALLIIYRDHLPGNLTPLLPWLHSSEACEHTFGNCRCLVKDFTYLDFLYMIPRLHVSLRHAVLRSRTSDGKSRASGYNHTYFDSRDVNALVLSTYPTDEEMALLAATARDEANMLLIACGIDPTRLARVEELIRRGQERLPSLESWLVGAGSKVQDEEGWETDDDMSDAASIGDAEELQDLLDFVDSDQFLGTASSKQQERTERLSCAATALMVEDHRKIQIFAESAEDDQDTLAGEASELSQYLQRLVANPIVKPIAPAPSIFGQAGLAVNSPQKFDFSHLISLRRAHQTRQASTGIRVRSVPAQNESEVSNKRKLIQAMHGALKEFDFGHGLTSGMARDLRTQSLGGTATGTFTGNAANARAAAAGRATQALKSRRELYTKAGVPESIVSIIATARVTVISPLLPLQWVLVAVDTKQNGNFAIFLAQVITLYARGGGKYSSHGAVVDGGKSNIAAFSFIGVQLYRGPDKDGVFSPILDHMDLLGCSSFAHLPAIQVLVKIPKPTVGPDRRVALPNDAFGLVTQLNAARTKISAAIKAQRSRKKDIGDDLE